MQINVRAASERLIQLVCFALSCGLIVAVTCGAAAYHAGIIQ